MITEALRSLALRFTPRFSSSSLVVLSFQRDFMPFVKTVVFAFFFLTLSLRDDPLQAASDVYCGVYCLHGAARALGVDADLSQLIQPDFISSQAGSSIDDLKLAGKSLNLSISSLFGLGLSSLTRAETPLILHVSPTGVEGSYTHWMLFLGIEDGKAVIHDGPGGLLHCELDSIMARWDGIALAVSHPNIPTALYSHEISRFSLLLLYSVLFAFICDGLVNRFFANRLLPRNALSLFCIVAISLVASTFNFATGGSSDSAYHARRGIDAAAGRLSFDQVTALEAVALEESGVATLIDCRFTSDFGLGSIPNAISLPVDAGLGMANSLLSNIEKRKQVIVFCQSSRCGFSKYIAAFLISQGFHHVSVMPGGYQEWQQRSVLSE